MIYALIGLFFGMVAFGKLKVTDKKQFLIFIGTIAASFLISLLKHNSNTLVHFYSLFMGIMCFWVGKINLRKLFKRDDDIKLILVKYEQNLIIEYEKTNNRG
jgi:uncharacterized membrane protein